MTRRNIELILLCIAAPLVVLLFSMIVLGDGQALNLTTLGTPLGIFMAFILAHLATRKFAPGADPGILPLAFALSGVGIAFVTRLQPSLAIGQVVWLFLGIVLMILVIALIRNLDKLAQFKYTFMLLGLVFLLSPLIPGIGTDANMGSRIWLAIGPFSFQPGEIAKICIVLFLAGYLAQNREMLSVFTNKVGPIHVPDFRSLIPLLLMWVIAMLVIIFEKDLGSALVFFFVFLAMLYVATGRRIYVVIGLSLAAIGCVVLWAFFSHVQVRVDTWLNPFADAQNTGYQLVQSIYSMADGGMFGVGIGNGLADQIPVVESDFIFVPIAEETGLLGAAGILMLFLCFAIRGLVTAARAKSDVSSFIATGCTAIIIMQAFIIVGGVTRLIPLTGITLPFISQGGSSLISAFIIVGLLLKAGDQATGVNTEMTSGTTSIGAGVLGRVSLGKRLTTLMITFALMFAALVANLTFIMVVNAEEYQNMPGNNHTLAKQEHIERGTISTYDNVVLAESVPNEDGTYTRNYPAGTLASHIVGYSSPLYGTAGIEASYNDTLQGSRDYATWTDVLNDYAGINQRGNDVRLTINSTIQRAAQDALKGYTGACVVLDPRTGAVLGMASSPTYNAGDIEQLLKNAASGSKDSALLNRATQSLYAPGSTFKTLSLATALEENIATEESVYNAPASMDIGNAPVTNYGNEDYGSLTLSRATDLSSNTVFGQLGVQIGPEKLVSSASDYGFNKELKLDLPLATSLMPRANEMTTWETAWAACGQPVGEHESPAGPQATVLQMAMLMAAVANDGELMTPYFVDSIYNANGERSSRTSPQTFSHPLSADIANRVTEVLKGVVNEGTGTAARINGIQVAGKTGTAETGKTVDDSWFAGFAPADNPSVVVALVLEEAGSGISTGRAGDVLEVALQVQGER